MRMGQRYQGVTERPTSPLPRSLPRAVTMIGLTAMLACAALGMAGWRGGPGDGVIVAAIGLLIGVPHGSVDHLLPEPGTGQRPHDWRLVAFLAWYIAVVVTFLAVVFFVPAVALIAFLAFSAVHFGTADIAFNRWRRGNADVTGPRDGLDLATQTIAYGGSMSLLFFLRWPAEVEAALSVLGPRVSELVTGPARIGAFITLAAIAVTALRHLMAGAWLEAAEVLVLLLCAWFVPPLVSFGVYFAAWHALRHMSRIWIVVPGVHRLLTERRVGRAYRQTVLQVLPTTLATYAILAAILVLGGQGFLHDQFLRASIAAVLAAVTIPHVGMILRYDQRLLRPARRGLERAPERFHVSTPKGGS